MIRLENVLQNLVLIMAFMIFAGHVVPFSLQFLENATCITIIMVEPEEEVKELVHEAPTQVLLTTLYVGEYLSIFQAIPPSPYLETLSPPPDFL